MFSFKKMLSGKDRPLIMGILNVTPDSFSDGGEAFTIEAVIEKVNNLCEQGADIIDVGACSTAPMNATVTEAEEIKRLKVFLPEVIKASSVPVSVDTFRPNVARFALESGALIVNDESGIYNIGMAETVKAYGAGWVFMHTGGGSSSDEIIYPNGVTAHVLSFFADMKRQAVEYGINEEQLCYDCGIGFGKTRQNDVELLRDCKSLSSYSPLLIGVSRKRVIGEIVGADNPKDRVWGSVAAAIVAGQNGAHILRVHDVKETIDAFKVVSSIEKGVL